MNFQKIDSHCNMYAHSDWCFDSAGDIYRHAYFITLHYSSSYEFWNIAMCGCPSECLYKCYDINPTTKVSGKVRTINTT